MKHPFWLLLTCLVIGRLHGQSPSYDYLVALTGTDCYSCDLNLQDLRRDCLDQSRVLYVFPEDFRPARHWSKELKATYQPHIFSDSLSRRIKGESPLSMLAVVSDDGEISGRYPVKQVRCEDLSMVAGDLDYLKIDSLDFNSYMVNRASSVEFHDGLFCVNNGGHRLLIFNKDMELLHEVHDSLLLDHLEESLYEIGFDSATVALNMTDDVILDIDAHPFHFLKTSLKGDTLRVLVKMYYAQRLSNAGDSERVYVQQGDFILDINLTTDELHLIQVPFVIPELGGSHYYSFNGATFIHHDRILLRNATSADHDLYGILNIENGAVSYEHLAVELADFIPRTYEGSPVSYPIQFDELSRYGEAFHIPLDSSVYNASGDVLFTVQPDPTLKYFWMESVLEVNGNVWALFNDRERGSFLKSEEQLLQLSDGLCTYLGKDEEYVYFLKVPAVGVVLRARKGRLSG